MALPTIYDEEELEGAPADFGGRVLPNPTGLQPMLDTDASETERLSGGAKPVYAEFPKPASVETSFNASEMHPGAGAKPPAKPEEVTAPEVSVPPSALNLTPAAPAAPLKGFSGKEAYHAQMKDFEDRLRTNRGATAQLDVHDPDYVKKLLALEMQAGGLRHDAASYEREHPWGSMESAHPGIGGKIGHAFGVIGNVAGSLVTPQIMPEIPGSQANLATKERGGEQEESAALKGLTENAQAQEQEAIASKAPSEIKKNESEAELQKTQETKLAESGPKLDEQYAAAVESSISAGRNPATDPKVQQIADTITQIQKQTGTNKAPKVTYNQGIPVTVEDGDGNAFDINDPNLPTALKPLALRALASHAQNQAETQAKEQRARDQQEKMFALRQNALSNATKTMVEASPKVVELSTRIKELLSKDVDNLGPLSSRWRELWAGKIGTEDKQFTKLRTDVGLLNTLLMRMHVGARGGVDIMHHFQDLLDSGKQEPGNMLAALEEIDSYAKDVQRQGEQKGVHTEGSDRVSTERPSGATHTGRSKIDHKLYYLDAQGNKLGPAE